MKKFFYSTPLKFTAVILCALCVALASYSFTTGFIYGDNVYMFENSYEESEFARSQVYNEFYYISHQLRETCDRNDNIGSGYYSGNEDVVASQSETVPGGIQLDKLTAMPYSDKWEYHINVNGNIVTNVPGSTYIDFENSPMAIGIQHIGGVNSYIGDYHVSDVINSPTDDYEVCVRMPLSVYEQNKVEWEAVKSKADRAAMMIIILLCAAVALFIYLLCATGRKYGTDRIQIMLIDRMYVELTGALLLTVLILGPLAVFVFGATFIFEEKITIAHMLTAMFAFGVTAISVTLLLSLVRNMKNQMFMERSLIKKIISKLWKWTKLTVKFIWRGAKRVKREIYALLGKRSGIIMAAILIVYTLLASINFVIALIMMVLGCLFLAARAHDLDNIKKGVSKYKNGNYSYKIESVRSEDYRAIAEDINDIGSGMAAAIEERVKAERMKSELITNVSHDLKTPLTSIINYADLLSKEKLTPDEANDYVAIIKQKSARLRRITSDLFDISKVRSGNEEFDIEDIDLCLLINQAMAEMNEQIEQSGLDFRVSSPDDEVVVKADGKKMSRVFENLIVNCVKFAMKGTRVYIDIKSGENGADVEIKNIAGYEMTFDESEITERFVRGDSARTGEGSGLGLAIVKSYIEGCGGSVTIKKDGDLFKVVLHFVK